MVDTREIEEMVVLIYREFLTAFTSGNNDESSTRIFLERIQFVKVL